MESQNRKSVRLKNYDYSSDGIYFVTFCTAGKEKILWQTVAATIGRHNDYVLSETGTSVFWWIISPFSAAFSVFSHSFPAFAMA